MEVKALFCTRFPPIGPHTSPREPPTISEKYLNPCCPYTCDSQPSLLLIAKMVSSSLGAPPEWLYIKGLVIVEIHKIVSSELLTCWIANDWRESENFIWSKSCWESWISSAVVWLGAKPLLLETCERHAQNWWYNTKVTEPQFYQWNGKKMK